MSLVNISVVGNLAKPPEQMHFSSGKIKTTLIIAINNFAKTGKSSNEVDFYKVETWGKLAELAGKYCNKGSQIAVTGRFFLDHWIDKQGKNRVTPVVEATQLSLPPRLKVINADDAAANSTTEANPIGGLIDISDQEGAPSTTSSTYGNPFEEVTQQAQSA